MFKVEPISLRFVLVIGIIVALMIPLLAVMVLVQERKGHYESAVSDVAQAWSGQQTVAGPMLLIRTGDVLTNQDRVIQGRILVSMPSRLSIAHESSHEVRNRGIYKLPVFTAAVSADAEFLPVDVAELDGGIEEVSLAIGVSDSRGVRGVGIRWDDQDLDVHTSAVMPGIGSIIEVELDRNTALQGGTVRAELELRGTGRFSVLPIGDRTEVAMKSDWPDPKFDGRFLPDEREVRTDGFSASWSTHALARVFLSVVSSMEFGNMIGDLRYGSPKSSDLGYSILTLNTPYRAVERSIKYGALFIVMTMISIVCLELVSKAKFHIIQYGVVGAGLVLFFLTLLSLSEHIGFAAGYVVAAAILAVMNVSYVLLVARNTNVGLSLAAVLLILYVALYLVLQLNEYALLVGSGLLIVLLAALMFATRSLRPSEST